MARDPYRNYKFEVEVNGFTSAAFTKVSGLGSETEVIDHRDGADNETPRKIPGQTSFTEVVFTRGISVDSDFIDWCNGVYDSSRRDGAQGANDDFRRTITVYLKDKSGARVRSWTLERAWPSKRETEDLDAGASEILMQNLTVQHEGLVERSLV